MIFDRRFAPLFWVQFLGALNDNVFKNALVILVAYRSMTLGALKPDAVVALAAGLFILPFFLASGWAGKIADRARKSIVIRWVKIAEIAIMILGAAAFVFGDLELLLAVLFCMGAQSAFFGPAKYSVVPELVSSRALVRANAFVETGTFIAILAGTILGGALVGMQRGPWPVAVAVVVIAVFGFLASLRMPPTPGHPDAELGAVDPIRPTLRTWRAAKSWFGIRPALATVSWFWYLGAWMLTILPHLVKDVIGGNEAVTTLFLALFCVGVGVGSFICARASRGIVDFSLAWFGALLSPLFLVDLGLLLGRWQTPAGSPIGIGEFLATPGAWRVALDFVGVSLAGGVLTVPLYAALQARAAPTRRSSVIAANNVMNSVAMVLSSIVLIVLSKQSVAPARRVFWLGVQAAAWAIVMFTFSREARLRLAARFFGNREVVVSEDLRALMETADDFAWEGASVRDWLGFVRSAERPMVLVMPGASPGLRWLLGVASFRAPSEASVERSAPEGRPIRAFVGSAESPAGCVALGWSGEVRSREIVAISAKSADQGQK